MARTPVWKSIAASVEAEIAAGHYGAGDKLPTESALAARFGVNRHTVRHALADLGERGIVRSRRGSGVFVEAPPADYPIGRRVRFHQNIRATGRVPEKRVLHVESRAANAEELRALALEEYARVIAYEGLSLAGRTPIAVFRSVFPEARVPRMGEALAEAASVTEALRQNGIDDYVRVETRIGAERASATQALHLGLREGDLLLRTHGVNTELDGRPIEYGTTWFAADRVTLTVSHGE